MEAPSLSELQNQLHTWRKYNFPHSNSEQQLLGMMEELGELAKARLKSVQGIRPETTGDMAEVDAVIDMTIYAMGYFSYMGWDFEEWLHRISENVMKRDWIKYPGNGFPPRDISEHNAGLL